MAKRVSRAARARRGLSATLAAMTLSAVMLLCVACTRDELPHDPKDTAGTSAGTAADTRPAGTDKPMDPDKGTVAPDNQPGDPPAGTAGESKNFRSRFMH